MLLHIQYVPGLLGQILKGSRGHHENSDLYSNPWLETFCQSNMTITTNEGTQD